LIYSYSRTVATEKKDRVLLGNNGILIGGLWARAPVAKDFPRSGIWLESGDRMDSCEGEKISSDVKQMSPHRIM